MLSKRFPTFAAMAAGEVGLDGECIIKEHNALFSPTCKVAIGWNWRANVVVDFLEDIFERWRKWYAGMYRKSKTISLARSVIRILPNDYNFDLI